MIEDLNCVISNYVEQYYIVKQYIDTLILHRFWNKRDINNE